MANRSNRPIPSRTVQDKAVIVRDLRNFSQYWSSQIEKWKKDGTEKSAERKYAHQFWLDFLECFGYRGTRLDLFEFDTRRSSTRQNGRVDLFIPGIVIGEIKSVHIRLEAADKQIWDYLEGGGIAGKDYPHAAISTNFRSFHVFKTEGFRRAKKFDLKDLPRHFEDLVFLVELPHSMPGGTHPKRQKFENLNGQLQLGSSSYVVRGSGKNSNTRSVASQKNLSTLSVASQERLKAFNEKKAAEEEQNTDGLLGCGCLLLIILICAGFLAISRFGDGESSVENEISSGASASALTDSAELASLAITQSPTEFLSGFST